MSILPDDLQQKADARVLSWRDFKEYYGYNRAVKNLFKLKNNNILAIDKMSEETLVINDDTKIYLLDPSATIILNFIKTRKKTHINDVKLYAEKHGISEVEVDKIVERYVVDVP